VKIPYRSLVLLISCAASALAQSSIFTVAGSFPVGAGSANAAASVGLVVADFNRDGYADIASANTDDGTITILLGDGAGHFNQAAGSPVASPYFAVSSIATGDFNRDGNPDLVLSSTAGTAVLLGDGAGHFAVAKGLGSSSRIVAGPLILVGDFTGDGVEDLLIGNFGNIFLALGDGTGAFGPFMSVPVGNSQPSALVTADFNGDGKLDFAMINATDGTIHVYSGDGAGHFQSVFVQSPVGTFGQTLGQVAATGDFNGDVKAELLTFLANGGATQVQTLSWTGNTSAAASAFTAKASNVPFFPTAVVVADFNGDGKLDWAGLNNYYGPVEVYFGDGTGAFTAAPGSPFNVSATPFAIAAEDFNGDGKPDLAVDTGSAVVPLLNASGQPVPYTYDFPHFSLGQGWQTALTYVNYSPQSVTCQTSFFSDSGAPLAVSFGGAAAAGRTDVLPPGGEIHALSAADPTAVGGWAQGQCSGPVKASMLFRLYNAQGVAETEAGVNATTSPATSFITFAQTNIGIAFANPYPLTTNVRVTAVDATGKKLGSTNLALPPMGHTASNVSNWLNQNFTGSVQITSTFPIASLSLNAEAYTQADPVVSSLPPGDIGFSSSSSASYYFPHFSLGQGWQTVLTYTNTQGVAVDCQTTFFSDNGTQLPVAFGGPASPTRRDQIPAGGDVHALTTADPSAQGGWAQGKCDLPVKASLLFRQYNAQGVALAEAGVNGSTTPTTKFVTFAQTGTGVALANPSTTQTASVTITALDATGAALGSTTVNLPPSGHSATNVHDWLNKSFTGSVQIVSTIPIVSLSINAEAYTAAYPVISSLPPGDLDGTTVLAPGH